MLSLETANGRLIVALSICVAVLLCGYSIYLSFVCLVAIGACVFYITINLLDDSAFRTWITDSLLKQFGLQLPEHLTQQSDQPEAKQFNTFSREFPWDKITLPKSLNSALEHFANSLIEDYINRWYKAEISQDNMFLLEIKYQIRYGSATAIRNLRNYNFAELIQTELLPLVVLHANRVSQLIDAADEGTARLEEQMSKVFSNDLHVAMQSPESCEHYLSEIADQLVVRLMDGSRLSGRELDNDAPTTYATNHWPSEVCRNFLRQLVLSAVLLPIVDFITNPDTLNLLVVAALEPNKSELEDISNDERVQFLENLSKFSQNELTDSLLTLKLSDLVRDPRLLQIFDNYLRDVSIWTTRWLDCFLQTNDVLRRLQRIKDTETPEFNETFSDAWLLFSAFIHKSARTQIELFSDELLETFGKAIEERSYDLLLKSVEEVYMILYHELNYNFVIPFCQSEVYLGYLCGASSDATFEEQQVKTESESGQSTGLSITQIPSKIWNVLRGDYTESEEQKEEPPSEEVIQTKPEEELHETEIEDEMKPIDLIDASFLNVDEFSFDQSININAWKVSIPLIERRRRFRTGRIYFVYILTIERSDELVDQSAAHCSSGLRDTPKKALDKPVDDDDDEEENELEGQVDELEALSQLSQLPKAWSIIRSYDEFYVFDRRLRSHFGSNAQPFALLPDRKMMCPRTKQFLESYRKHFETFLQQLTRQPNLKNSELLFAFLTNPGESGFENSLISTNDIESSGTSPTKRKQSESDDGEYLKPFISRLLSRALINDDMHTVGIREEHAKFETYSLDSGAYSLNHDAASEDAHEQSMLPKISLKNPHLSHLVNAEKPDPKEVQAIENFQELSTNISSFAAYLLNLMLRPHRYLKMCLFTLVDLFSNTLNKLFGRELKTIMDGVLDENTILYIVRALHEVVFDENQAELSQEEIQQRAQQAERLLKHWLVPTFLPQISESTADRTNQTVHRIFNCFQNATLNRRLAFVLLDTLTQHILPPNAEQILDRLHSELKVSSQ